MGRTRLLQTHAERKCIYFGQANAEQRGVVTYMSKEIALHTYLEARCMKKSMAKNRTDEMFKEIKNMTGKFQPRLGIITDKNLKTLTDAKA